MVFPLLWKVEISWYIFASRVSSRGNRIGPVCLCVCPSVFQHSHSFDIWTWILTSQHDIMMSGDIHHGKRTLGWRNFTTRVAGGASMLRRFHIFLWVVSVLMTNCRHTDNQLDLIKSLPHSHQFTINTPLRSCLSRICKYCMNEVGSAKMPLKTLSLPFQMNDWHTGSHPVADQSVRARGVHQPRNFGKMHVIYADLKVGPLPTSSYIFLVWQRL